MKLIDIQSLGRGNSTKCIGQCYIKISSLEFSWVPSVKTLENIPLNNVIKKFK